LQVVYFFCLDAQSTFSLKPKYVSVVSEYVSHGMGHPTPLLKFALFYSSG
jgi:hypothetical protein